MISVLTCVVVSSSALPAPAVTLPRIILFATSSNLSKVTASSAILAVPNVPDPKLDALSAVNPDPSPSNFVAVTIPEKVAFPSVVTVATPALMGPT